MKVFRLGRRKKYHTNTIDSEKGFTIKRVKTKRKARLDFDEIQTLIDLDLSKHHKSLVAARDLFVVGCFTGLRFSDWSKVGRNHIIEEEGQELLEIMTYKTKAVVYIPLLKELKAVLLKHDYKLPEILSQVFNRNIKKVYEVAFPDRETLIVYSENKSVKSEKVKKHEIITSHAGRRSFATNFWELGIPAATLMQITEHQSEKDFFIYIDVDKKKLALRFALDVMEKRGR